MAGFLQARDNLPINNFPKLFANQVYENFFSLEIIHYFLVRVIIHISAIQRGRYGNPYTTGLMLLEWDVIIARKRNYSVEKELVDGIF